MLALSAAPMSPTALLMNAFNLSGLTAMMHLPWSNSAHSLPLARGCQAGTNGVEYPLEQEPDGAKEAPSMEEYRVKTDSQLNLGKCDPDNTGNYKKTDQGKEKAKAMTAELTVRLGELQERL